MATTPLSTRALSRLQAGNSGLTQAKKLADLYIKSHTNSRGKVTDPSVYQYVVDTYLSPFAGNVDADRAIQGYLNNAKSLGSSLSDQNDTVANFKRQEISAWWNDVGGDVGFRNPSVLALNTSQALDSVLTQVLNTIDNREQNGQSVDALAAYADTLAQRADSMRSLTNELYSGNLSPDSLDGYGYYVDTDPVTGQVRGASIAPVGLAPEDITKGTKRVDTTAQLGSAQLPVYLPVTQDQYGQYTARLGDNKWQGSGTGSLTSVSGSNSFAKSGFTLSDSTMFPQAQTGVQKGQFASIPYGSTDANGNYSDLLVYKGLDGKTYTVPNDVRQQLENDPHFKDQLSGYIMRLSPTEADSVRQSATPMNTDIVSAQDTSLDRFSKLQSLQQDAVQAKSASDSANSFFGKTMNSVKAVPEVLAGAARGVASFFSNRNRPNQPDKTSQSVNGQTSAPDVIDQGQSIFRNPTP